MFFHLLPTHAAFFKSPFLEFPNGQKTWPRLDPLPPRRCHARVGWGLTLRRATRSCPAERPAPCPTLCPHSKLLHKRDSDKVDAQEENFLPKYQRVKDLCQRAEYRTACEQLGQVRGRGRAPGRGTGAPLPFLASQRPPSEPGRASEAGAPKAWCFAHT